MAPDAGLIFDIKRFALHDGPGIRTTAFLKGCHLGCPWCQNPEGISKRTQLWYHPERCIRCGICVGVCPHSALSMKSDVHSTETPLTIRHRGRSITIDRGRCLQDGACTTACPSKALEMDSRWISAADLVEEFLKDRLFYETSGGGITLSGGEPLDQPRFCGEVLRLGREAGLHTALETSLSASQKLVAELAPLTDLFLADLKIWNPSDHRSLTGVDRDPILENIRYLAELGSAIRVRTPLIPGYTAAPDNLRAIARFVRSLPGDVPLELINFNPLAAGKYRSLDRDYPLANQRSSLTEAVVAELSHVVEEEGVTLG